MTVDQMYTEYYLFIFTPACSPVFSMWLDHITCHLKKQGANYCEQNIIEFKRGLMPIIIFWKSTQPL